MRRAALSRLWLFALLLFVPLGLRALEADVFFFLRVATAGEFADPAARWIYAFENIIACAGYIVAGIAFDRFGLKRGFSLVILAWCALVPFATVVDPLAYRELSPLLTAMLPGAAITGYLVAARLAWPVRRRGPVVIALVILYDELRGGVLHTYFAQAHRAIAETWQVPILALTTIGAILLVVWLAGLRTVDDDSGLDLRPPPAQPDAWRDILSDKAIWIVVALEFCVGIVWHFSQSLRWELEPLGRNAPATTVFFLTWASPAAALVAAWMSDLIYRKRRAWIGARQAPIVAGFVVAGVAPLLGALATQSGPALQMIDLVAIGATRLISVVFLDVVPRRFAGRAIGFVLASEAVATLYLRPVFDFAAKELHSVTAIIVLFAALGAVLAALLLPHLRPAER